MLGYTFGNLDCKEGKFFSDIDELMNPGDYMLLDYVAINERWDYAGYSKIWHDDWDNDMRKFLATLLQRGTVRTARKSAQHYRTDSPSNAEKVISTIPTRPT